MLRKRAVFEPQRIELRPGFYVESVRSFRPEGTEEVTTWVIYTERWSQAELVTFSLSVSVSETEVQDHANELLRAFLLGVSYGKEN